MEVLLQQRLVACRFLRNHKMECNGSKRHPKSSKALRRYRIRVRGGQCAGDRPVRDLRGEVVPHILDQNGGGEVLALHSGEALERDGVVALERGGAVALEHDGAVALERGDRRCDRQGRYGQDCHLCPLVGC